MSKAPKLGDKNALRFGTGGEYTPPMLATEQARYQFLQAVQRRCPLPLLHLRDRVFPFYAKWVDDLMKSAKAYQLWKESPEGAKHREESAEFFKACGDDGHNVEGRR